MKASSTRIAIAVIGVIALLLGLGACGGSGNADIVGVWQLDTLDAGAAGSFSGDDIPAAARVSLTLNADGSASLDRPGESEEGTWTRSGALVSLTATSDSDDGSMDLTLADGTLTGALEGYTLVFVKK